MDPFSRYFSKEEANASFSHVCLSPNQTPPLDLQDQSVLSSSVFMSPLSIHSPTSHSILSSSPINNPFMTFPPSPASSSSPKALDVHQGIGPSTSPPSSSLSASSSTSFSSSSSSLNSNTNNNNGSSGYPFCTTDLACHVAGNKVTNTGEHQSIFAMQCDAPLQGRQETEQMDMLESILKYLEEVSKSNPYAQVSGFCEMIADDECD